MNNSDYQFTTVVGIDVAKKKIDIADNHGSTVKTIGNNKKELTQWIESITDRTGTIVVMEATGGYESLLVELLHQHQIALAVVNPRRVSSFAIGIGRDAKTDPIDAGTIVLFGEVVQPAPQVVQSDEQIKLGGFVERRRQILDLINQEQSARSWPNCRNSENSIARKLQSSSESRR